MKSYKWKYMAKVLRLKLSAPFLFFCLFSLIVSASNFNSSVGNILKDTDKYILSDNNNSSTNADNYYSDFLNTPFQSPAEPLPTPSEPNDKDNEENQNDDDWSSVHFPFYDYFYLIYKSSDASLAQFEQNVLRRTKISLVVLYHAWKSFLF
jgi:hypothetical protein